MNDQISPAPAAAVSDPIVVDIYDMRRAERAIAGFHSIILYTYYGWVATIPFTFAFDVAQFAYHLVSRPLQAYGNFSGFVVILFVFLFSYYVYGAALMRLPRSGCVTAAAVFLVIACAEWLYFLSQLQFHQTPVSLLLSAVAAIWLMLLTAAVAGCWIRLALTSRRDRYLMRSPFEKVTDKFMVQFVAGVPPIANFASGARPQALFYASNFCLGLAFTSLISAIVMETEPDPVAQLAEALEIVVVWIIFAAVANKLRIWAQNNIRFSVESLTSLDRRAPVLFLRAFRDDLVALPSYSYSLIARILNIYSPARSLDHLLLAEGTLYGPVVALGNPSDPLPPYGVAREYVSNADWQTRIRRLSQESRAVILCVDDTDAIWWEVEHLAEAQIAKVLFMVHPKFREPDENRRIMASLIKGIPQLRNNPDAAALLNGGNVICFFLDASMGLHVGMNARFSYYGYLLAVRWFLRRQLGLAISLRR